MTHYERRWPHCDLAGQAFFVAFRLHGTLPASRIFLPERLISGKAFVAMDRILDRATGGRGTLAVQRTAPSVECLFRPGNKLHERKKYSDQQVVEVVRDPANS